MNDISCVELFCGVGGLTWGLKSASIDVRFGLDVDTNSGSVYERNTGIEFVASDVRELSASDLRRMFEPGKLRLLAGCAPCQPFSTYGRTRKREHNDWQLLKSFGRLVDSIRPELITMENVPGLAGHSVFTEFIDLLVRAGYSVSHGVLSCELYGVPQRRRRLVLNASLLGMIHLPEPATIESRTVESAIRHFPPIVAGEAHPDDPLHAAAGLSPLNLERIRNSKPGGSWRDWPPHLIAECHRTKTGQTYPSVYGRMRWDAPSPTITTQCYGYGSGRFGHPEQDRAISLREAAVLQSFPDDWDFIPLGRPVEFTPIGKAIGNAVPPKLGEAIGRALIDHVALS